MLRLAVLDLRGVSLRRHSMLSVPGWLLDESSLRLRPGLSLLQLNWHPRKPRVRFLTAVRHNPLLLHYACSAFSLCTGHGAIHDTQSNI